MIFTSARYMVFLSVVMFLLWVLRNPRARKGLVLIASLVFYADWDVRLVPLLVGLAIINYYCGIGISRAASQSLRKRWLIVGISCDLAVLCVFKYLSFFVSSAATALAPLGVRAPVLSIILPVGISFMTFEVISYLVDVYRGSSQPARSVLDLALLVAFFPHLIAGPILKPSVFLDQLDRNLEVRWPNVDRGVQIFLIGMLKKVIVADRLAPFVDAVFAEPSTFAPQTTWLAAFAYGVQIYCDFSGYSDMAIGSALCVGIRIPRNFASPYLATSIGEFWRRWHISLSSWFRDYLYIPLGGNRMGLGRQAMNLMVVMLLCGLWHGANWTFVVWGGLHGAALVTQRVWARLGGASAMARLPVVSSWALTLVVVTAAWVLFRSPDFGTATTLFRKMTWLDPPGTQWICTSAVVLLPICMLGHTIGARLGDYPRYSLGTFAGAFVAGLICWTLLFGAPKASSPFIYFQF